MSSIDRDALLREAAEQIPGWNAAQSMAIARRVVSVVAERIAYAVDLKQDIQGFVPGVPGESRNGIIAEIAADIRALKGD